MSDKITDRQAHLSESRHQSCRVKKQGTKPGTQNQGAQTPPHIWAFTTYFAEGLPYTLIRTVSSFFFRSQGVSLEAVGLTSLFAVPWIIKFLWAPFLDSYGTKRTWLLFSQGFISLALLLIALLSPLSWTVSFIALLFFITSFVAATHDIAIDGYYMEALDRQNQAKFVGYRVMAYRLAMMFGSGIIITVGTSANWFLSFTLAALTVATLLTFHLFKLPVCEKQVRAISLLLSDICTFPFMLRAFLITATLLLSVSLYQSSPHLSLIPLSGVIGLFLALSLVVLILCRTRILSLLKNRCDSSYAQAFLTYVDRSQIGVIIAFIIFVRAGEFMLAAMVGPFFIDNGFQEHYGWITGAVGLPCSIIGAMAGGWCISKYSFKKMIWPFLLAQNLTNLFYMGLAVYVQQIDTGPPAAIDLLTISAVTAFDHLAGGLGTAVLMTFLMRLCRGKFKAAHYAIGTGLMSVSGVYTGAFSGFLVAWMGYAVFFGVSFLVSLPGMMLVFFLPELKKSA